MGTNILVMSNGDGWYPAIQLASKVLWSLLIMINTCINKVHPSTFSVIWIERMAEDDFSLIKSIMWPVLLIHGKQNENFDYVRIEKLRKYISTSSGKLCILELRKDMSEEQYDIEEDIVKPIQKHWSKVFKINFDPRQGLEAKVSHLNMLDNDDLTEPSDNYKPLNLARDFDIAKSRKFVFCCQIM